MTSKRPALRCRAMRTNGNPCGNYAMVGARVCHAHGGRAPQVRGAALRRLQTAELYGTLSRHLAEQEAERAALAPWARELRALRWNSMVGIETPEELARRARLLARQLSRSARILRDYARAVTIPDDADEESSCPGG